MVLVQSYQLSGLTHHFTCPVHFLSFIACHSFSVALVYFMVHHHTHTYTHTHTHSFLSVQDLRVTVRQPDLHHSCLLVQDILDILFWIVSPSDGARVAIDAVAYKTRASSTCVDSITFRRCKHLWDRHCLQGASFFRCMLHI